MWPIVISGIPFADQFPPKEGRVHPTTVRITRAGFEALLRRLVMSSCQNVRYLAGTVLGLEQADSVNEITGVRVRTATKEEITLPAILAIGTLLLGIYSGPALTIFFRLYGCQLGWFTMAERLGNSCKKRSNGRTVGQSPFDL